MENTNQENTNQENTNQDEINETNKINTDQFEDIEEKPEAELSNSFTIGTNEEENKDLFKKTDFENLPEEDLTNKVQQEAEANRLEEIRNSEDEQEKRRKILEEYGYQFDKKTKSYFNPEDENSKITVEAFHNIFSLRGDKKVNLGAYKNKEVNAARVNAGGNPSKDDIIIALSMVSVKKIQAFPPTEANLRKWEEALIEIKNKGLFDINEIKVHQKVDPRVKEILNNVKNDRKATLKIGDDETGSENDPNQKLDELSNEVESTKNEKNIENSVEEPSDVNIKYQKSPDGIDNSLIENKEDDLANDINLNEIFGDDEENSPTNLQSQKTALEESLKGETTKPAETGYDTDAALSAIMDNNTKKAKNNRTSPKNS